MCKNKASSACAIHLHHYSRQDKETAHERTRPCDICISGPSIFHILLMHFALMARCTWVLHQHPADLWIILYCISIGWLVDIGRSSSHTVRWSSLISGTVRVYLWLQDCDSSHPWTSLTAQHWITVLEPRPKMSPCFSQDLSFGMAKNCTRCSQP